MQNLHCGSACSNTLILEAHPDFGPLDGEIMNGAFAMEKGMAFPSTQSGLGITLTEEIKECYAFVSGSGEFNRVPGKILSGLKQANQRQPPKETSK